MERMLFSDDRFFNDFKNGNQNVLTEVYRNYAPGVARFLYKGFSFKSGEKDCCFKGYRNNCDLVNAVQSTFEKAFSKNAIHSYDGTKSYESYLFSIAKNVVIDELRQKHISVADDIDPESVLNEDPDNSPEKEVLIEELRNLIIEFKSILKPEERNILQCRFNEGYSQEYTAEITGMTRARVRTLEKSVRLKALKFFGKSGYLNDKNGRAVINVMLMHIFKI